MGSIKFEMKILLACVFIIANGVSASGVSELDEKEKTIALEFDSQTSAAEERLALSEIEVEELEDALRSAEGAFPQSAEYPDSVYKANYLNDLTLTGDEAAFDNDASTCVQGEFSLNFPYTTVNRVQVSTGLDQGLGGIMLTVCLEDECAPCNAASNGLYFECFGVKGDSVLVNGEQVCEIAVKGKTAAVQVVEQQVGDLGLGDNPLGPSAEETEDGVVQAMEDIVVVDNSADDVLDDIQVVHSKLIYLQSLNGAAESAFLEAPGLDQAGEESVGEMNRQSSDLAALGWPEDRQAMCADFIIHLESALGKLAHVDVLVADLNSQIQAL